MNANINDFALKCKGTPLAILDENDSREFRGSGQPTISTICEKAERRARALSESSGEACVIVESPGKAHVLPFFTWEAEQPCSPEEEKAVMARREAHGYFTEYFVQALDASRGAALRAKVGAIRRAHGGKGPACSLECLPWRAQAVARGEWRGFLGGLDYVQDYELHGWGCVETMAEKLMDYSVMCEHLPRLVLTGLQTQDAVK